MKFWAKTTLDAKPGISVFDHMINVGHVARCLAESAPGLLDHFQIEAAAAAALAALHDLGKISPGFQRKCEVWLKENGLDEVSQRWTWDTTMESDHGKVTHAAVQDFMVCEGVEHHTAKFLSSVLGGHHGRLSPPSDRGFKPSKQICESHSGIDWGKERGDAASAVCETFSATLTRLAADSSSPGLWWLAGLTSVADWIGSDETFFPADADGRQTDAAAAARQAITTTGFLPPEITPGLSFHDLFHDPNRPDLLFNPNEMQSRAIATIDGPGVYVIEAPMGTGKTEAALGAAYQLLSEKKARGIYFALPTQATSNRMHQRMAEFVRRIAPTAVGSRIIHGNSWLLDRELGFSPAASAENRDDDARVMYDWFASAKRALLAPFGVGTVDQALLGVVAAKHFFVRHYALAGKVVVLDEVHSYDVYTGRLIDKLISHLEGLDCTVIVLSATLTAKRRRQIVQSPNEDDDNESLSYPLITGRRRSVPFAPVPARPPKARDVEIAFRPDDESLGEAVAAAQHGACVLWICNTVDSAQRQYRILRDLAGERYPVGLLHSRFPFWRREELENEWMERLGKTGATRCASILVSTQIVEQSVDLDADLLVTELAPTDMLLQRTGRLWRHERGRRGMARLVILEESRMLNEFRAMDKQAIVDCLGGKAYVYAPYVLLRSLEVWRERNRITLPSQIRGLIEATYEQRDCEPESWQQLQNDWFATDSGKRLFAELNSNLWTVAMEDEEGTQTRLNEIPTLSLVLCRRQSKTDAEFIDGSLANFAGEDFRLATAQAIHRNFVRIPTRYFGVTKAHRGISRYLHGPQRVGVVGSDGAIAVEGLENGIRLSWSSDFGIVIEKMSDKEEP